MSANRADPERLSGLSRIAGGYRAILCDVWGVVHNGLRPFAGAVDALARFRAGGGLVILITNAPRPRRPVLGQLDHIGVDRAAYDRVVTSGDVARGLLVEHGEARILHLGPDRDLSLYEGLPITLAAPEDAEVVSCTGLYDEDNETADDYVQLLTKLRDRGLAMVCANPDLVVERGDKLIPCAGALAERYVELGGRVAIAGKPHPPIYDEALAELAELAGGPVPREGILAIGDGLPTDIRGGNQAGLDTLFISGGIHAIDFGAVDEPEAALVGGVLTRSGLGAVGFMPRLVW
jgi:HAD superfamily hydrolase (TIGR01459 family)